ncbi:response regulator [Nodosilinea sp. LEGE 06152]|uniref:response regulator n=1 Tax=Nodosilinea sp. LEGE 06152 TaxID=2777966 RepID=UPI00187FBDA7|nr:response regulator [Nodosilinea sp. LEGE 06152]MBE9159450.1 response regulator [Nodosilinea sp. LEGE 06152]
MNGRSAQYSKPIVNYLRIKKLQIFPVLKRLNFSGKLTWSAPEGHQWILFFNRGQVVYGHGGVHPTRQWYRQAQARLPEFDLSYQTLQKSLVASSTASWLDGWDYHLLHNWLSQGRLSPQALQEISTNIVADILFDVVQTPEAQYQLARQPALDSGQVPIAINEAALLPSVTDRWEAWLEGGLEAYSPNLAPVIQHPEPIRAQVSPGVYASLMQLLDGQRSLRDLAVKLGQDVFNLTQALQPYIQAGWIGLVEVADFPAPGGGDPPIADHQRPLKIACVDDSPMVCKAMGQVIRAAGYDFVPITEGAKAIPTLLAQKPDLVFLDLVMPDTNGYEICSSLRKMSRFKAVPIIILSGSDGLVDQVRARLLGATDFLSKPMEPIVILSVIRKHLALTRT